MSIPLVWPLKDGDGATSVCSNTAFVELTLLNSGTPKRVPLPGSARKLLSTAPLMPSSVLAASMSDWNACSDMCA